MVQPDAYDRLQAISKDFSIPGKFLAIAGQEFNTISKGNHVNVFEANSLIAPSEVENGDFKKLYDDWLPEHSNKFTVLQFNHPNTIFKNGEYGIDDYNNDIEALCKASNKYACLIEIIKTDSHGTSTSKQHVDETPKRVKAYLYAINNGWKVAPTANQDNHKMTWGTSTESRTCVIAKDLTKDSIMEAIKERRCYASEDEDMKVYFKAGDYWMGSTVSKDKVEDLNIRMVDDKEKIATYTVNLYEDEIGGQPVSINEPIETFNLKNNEEKDYKLNSPQKGTYYLIRVTQSSNPGDPNKTEDDAWTAPIWIQ
jgi:hypothetical protein